MPRTCPATYRTPSAVERRVRLAAIGIRHVAVSFKISVAKRRQVTGHNASRQDVLEALEWAAAAFAKAADCLEQDLDRRKLARRIAEWGTLKDAN